MIQSFSSNESSSRPFVVGIDSHSSPDFFTTNNPQRFPDHKEYLSRDNFNDFANKAISNSLGGFKIDCVFASRADKVLHYMRERVCRALLFHARVEDYGDTTRIIMARRSELMLVYIYNASQMIGDFADVFENRRMYTLLEDGFYQALDGSFSVIKPLGIRPLVDYIRNRFQQI